MARRMPGAFQHINAIDVCACFECAQAAALLIRRQGRTDLLHRLLEFFLLICRHMALSMCRQPISLLFFTGVYRRQWEHGFGAIFQPAQMVWMQMRQQYRPHINGRIAGSTELADHCAKLRAGALACTGIN